MAQLPAPAQKSPCRPRGRARCPRGRCVEEPCAPAGLGWLGGQDRVGVGWLPGATRDQTDALCRTESGFSCCRGDSFLWVFPHRAVPHTPAGCPRCSCVLTPTSRIGAGPQVQGLSPPWPPPVRTPGGPQVLSPLGTVQRPPRPPPQLCDVLGGSQTSERLVIPSVTGLSHGKQFRDRQVAESSGRHVGRGGAQFPLGVPTCPLLHVPHPGNSWTPSC